MKSLVKKQKEVIEAIRLSRGKVAQCCAKISKISAGCHD